jgi:hypothetical protein
MRSDAYTRTVLTVIAVCLLWLCAMNAGRPLAAQPAQQLSATAPQPVVVVGWGTLDEQGRATIATVQDGSVRRTDPNLPVKLVAVPAAPLAVRLPYTDHSPLPVRLDYTDKSPMPVGVTRIKPAAEWEPIRSAAEPEPTRPRPGGR